jgi:hypothetical protein
MPTVRCDHCDKLIGENEPILVIDRDRGHWTTLAAERGLPFAEVFHTGCFASVRESGTLDWLRDV